MAETRKQEMLKKLDDLKLIVEIPKLYCRNIVDVQMFILSKCSFYKIRNNYLFNKKYIY